MSTLYTPAILAAAVELADYAKLASADCEGSARSVTCGSEVAVQCTLDAGGRITQIGLQTRACAIGQAAAAVFARHAKGATERDLASTADAIESWLKAGAAQPDWPGLDLIAPALAYPARHSAILLPWKAACAALSSVPASR